MSNFTYEYKDIKQKTGNCETYEWDSVCVKNTDNLVEKRILYIGDSISCAIRDVANAQTSGKRWLCTAYSYNR